MIKFIKYIGLINNIPKLSHKIRYLCAHSLNTLSIVLPAKLGVLSIRDKLICGILVRYKTCLFLVPDSNALVVLNPSHES